MNADDNKAHYIKYHHISDNPAITEKVQPLAELSKRLEVDYYRDFMGVN
jgi:hypothetical protein